MFSTEEESNNFIYKSDGSKEEECQKVEKDLELYSGFSKTH
jgi:hypothetical protein